MHSCKSCSASSFSADSIGDSNWWCALCHPIWAAKEVTGAHRSDIQGDGRCRLDACSRDSRQRLTDWRFLRIRNVVSDLPGIIHRVFSPRPVLQHSPFCFDRLAKASAQSRGEPQQRARPRQELLHVRACIVARPATKANARRELSCAPAHRALPSRL